MRRRAAPRSTPRFETDRQHPGGLRPRVVLLAGLGLAAVLAAACTSSSGGSKQHDSSAARNNVVSGSATGTPSAGSSASASSSGTATSGAASSGAASSGRGNVDETVAPRTVTTRPAVALSKPAFFGDGVQLQVAAHQRVKGKATRPGEVSGPATRLTLRLTNGSAKTITLTNAVVTVTDARHAPLSALAGPPTAPFHGRLGAGRSTTATYVFALTKGTHDPYTISVSYSGSSAVVQFVGDAA